MKSSVAVASVLAVMMLASCAGGSSSPSTVTVTVTASPPNAGADAADTPPAPDAATTSYDGQALPLGTEATVEDEFSITALKFEPSVTVTYEDQEFLGLKAGQQWARIQAKICALSVPVEASWVGWEASTADGIAFQTPDSSFTDPFPRPLFPDGLNTVPPGQCRQGWVYLGIDKGAAADKLTYTAIGATPITWQVS